MDYHFYNLILFAVGCVYDLKNCRKFYHCARMSSVSISCDLKTHTVQATTLMQH